MNRQEAINAAEELKQNVLYAIFEYIDFLSDFPDLQADAIKKIENVAIARVSDENIDKVKECLNNSF